MFKFLIIAALVACAAAKPGVVAPVAAPLAAAGVAYANAPLYAAGGSSQVDIRNNYDGTQSSYTTAPFELTPPYSSRYVSGIPAAYAAAPLAAPLAASPYAAPLAASPYAAPLAAPYASPYTLGSPYAAPYAAPYSFAAPAPLFG
ncbi:cuticle protein 38 [Drosophila mojavensis]|uniref:VM domain-containing protein n=1 Tax=Drosophila mojavensis TaxID=7230 RepID=B4KW37_DROMO|nr:cuticle protein 38 [Drosophila mojavensis]EDW17425.1 uncharacterized protein Dmoj_GI12662 [Drosophila mojavensis]